MNLNNVSLMGRLTAKPELKTTPTGVNVCAFAVAIDNGFGENKTTSFIDCVAWRKTAEFLARYFEKGQLIALTGAIHSRTYKDKEGKNRKVVEIVCSNVFFAGDKQKTTGVENSGFENVEDEDLPF